MWCCVFRLGALSPLGFGGFASFPKSKKWSKFAKVRTTAHVRVDIGKGVIVFSSTTNEAVDDLGLAIGDNVVAVIKASDVMIAK